MLGKKKIYHCRPLITLPHSLHEGWYTARWWSYRIKRVWWPPPRIDRSTPTTHLRERECCQQHEREWTNPKKLINRQKLKATRRNYQLHYKNNYIITMETIEIFCWSKCTFVYVCVVVANSAKGRTWREPANHEPWSAILRLMMIILLIWMNTEQIYRNWGWRKRIHIHYINIIYM